jgi:Xaa-Pro aminopeptidase
MEPTDCFKTPSYEIEKRIKNIQHQLQQTEIGGLVVIQRVDLLYFSGTAQNAVLFIPVTGEPLLMVKKYYPRAVQESPLRNIVEIKSVKDIPGAIHDFYGSLPRTIGFELDVLPVKDFNFYQNLFAECTLCNGSDLILETRMIKSAWEIERMEEAAALSHRTFDYMKSVIEPGLTEMEFAAMAEGFARKYGHMGKLRVRDFQTEGYSWHILSGKNSAMVGLLDAPASGAGLSVAFPCGAGWKALEVHEPILIDFSIALNGYHMDETRMFAMGTMPQKVIDVCKAAIDIHNAVLEKLRPGMTAHEIYEWSLLTAQKCGYQESYLGPVGYQVSFVGHGIGMELVEPPFLARGRQDCLKPGMTFALEPKIVIEDEFMAGVESVFLVTEKGTRLISTVPVEIFIR